MAITTQMRTEVSQLYVALFGRAPDGDGLGFWVQLRDQGQTMAQIANTMYATTPARTYFPSFLTNAEIISAFYVNVLGRSADTDGAAFWTGKLNAAGATPGSVIAEMIGVVANYTGTDAAGVISKDLFNNKVSVAQYYGEKNGTAAGATAALSGVTNVATTVTAAKTAIDNGTIGGVNQGQNFTLTSGVDTVTGTNGNDTITADNTNANQLTAADTVNGGSGTDTLKIFQAAATNISTTVLGTLSGVENVYINGGTLTAAATLDVSTASGVTSVEIASPSAVMADGAAFTVKTSATQAANLTAIKGTAAGATSTFTVNGASTIGLNGVGTDVTLDVASATVTALTLNTSGSASTLTGLTNTGGGVTSLKIAGTAGLTVSAAPVAVATVDASGNTGAVAYTAGAASVGFKFTGGTGNDTVSFADNALATLTSGAQLVGGDGTDKIGILDTALTATETARINQATGFETLGLNANLTLDASTLTTIKSFAVDTAGTTSAISSLATGSSTAINVATTSLTLGTVVGVTDHAVAINTATAAGITVGTLAVTGITSLALTSNGTSANTITTFTNSDNSSISIKGSAGLTLALSGGTAVGSKIDGSAATGVLTLTGSNVVASGDTVIGGTGADVINGGKGNDTLTGGAGADTFTFTAGTAGDNASGAAFGQADVITDFVVGTDKLKFTSGATTDVVSVQQAAVQAAVTALAAGSTDAQIAAAMATANTTNLGVSFAVFGGNTYVLYELSGAGTGVAADDAFIKLTGVATAPTFAADVVA